MQDQEKSLIDQWQEVAEGYSAKIIGSRALRIYVKCLRGGKTKWATEIKAKYGRWFPQDDRTIAMAYALMANNKSK